MLNSRNAVAGLAMMAATILGAGTAFAAPDPAAGPGTNHPVAAMVRVTDPVTVRDPDGGQRFTGHPGADRAQRAEDDAPLNLSALLNLPSLSPGGPPSSLPSARCEIGQTMVNGSCW